MSPIQQRARTAFSFLGVIALALSPFVIYAAFNYARVDSVVVRAESPTTSPSPEESPSALPSPSPSPSLSPSPSPSVSSRPINSDITVEVRNAGGPKGAGRQVADELIAKGFKVIRVTDHAGTPVTGAEVYYSTDKAKGEKVAAELDGASEAKPLPPDLTTTANVLVLVGK